MLMDRANTQTEIGLIFWRGVCFKKLLVGILRDLTDLGPDMQISMQGWKVDLKEGLKKRFPDPSA